MNHNYESAWGHSFRFRQQNLCETPPGEEITMTSYPASNKTSLSLKPASQLRSYKGMLSGSYGRFFRIRHEKVRAAPLAEQWWWRHIRFAIKPRYLGNHAWQLISCYGSLSWSHGRCQNWSWKIARSAPWRRSDVDVITMQLAIKSRYLENYVS